MNCPACAEPIDVRTNLPGSQVLCSCGFMIAVPASPGPSARAAAPAAPRPPACPRCAAALVQVATIDGVSAHACPECGGVFADRAVVTAISSGALALDHAPSAPARRVDTSGPVKCPVCDELMTRLDYGKRSGVIVDLCIDHGTWFDADEIERVAAFISSGSLSGGGSAPPAAGDPQLPVEARHMMGQLQAQVIAKHHDDEALVRLIFMRYRTTYLVFQALRRYFH